MTIYADYTAGEYDDAETVGRAVCQGIPEIRRGGLCALSRREQLLRANSRYFARSGPRAKALEAIHSKSCTTIRSPNMSRTQSSRSRSPRDQLAGKEMSIGRFYLNRRNYTAAINRFRDVLTNYQTTRHAQEALYRLTEAYMGLGITDEAETAAAVLGHNFPDSEWYKDAYALLKSGGHSPQEHQELLDRQALPYRRSRPDEATPLIMLARLCDPRHRADRSVGSRIFARADDSDRRDRRRQIHPARRAVAGAGRARRRRAGARRARRRAR